VQARPYQRDAIAATLEGFKQFRKQLGVLPTGAGKTVVFSMIAEQFHQRGGRVLILAHREELVDQAIEKLHRATGLKAGKEKAEHHALRTDAVVVASVQSMARRLDKWPAQHFALAVCDEAHHAISTQWQTVLRHFDAHAKVLGVTATPDRGDKKNLGQYFENVAFEVSLFDLIDQGYLARIAVKSIPLHIDLNGVEVRKGDFDAAQLGDALAPYMRDIARKIRDEATFRRTLVFLPLIATSQKFVDVCRNEGLSAEHVDGESPDRKDILARFAAGEFDVLCNAMLLTEGFDDPGIDCVVVLRPTKSRALYSQMVGRGTRIAPFKQNLLLLDFLWSHEKHALSRPAHLVSGSDVFAGDITALLHEKANSAGACGGDSIAELDLEELANEAQAQREEKLRRELEENRKKKPKFISAEEFALNNGDVALTDYEPTMAWESRPVTEQQLKWLKNAKIDPASVRDTGHASRLLKIHFRNRNVAPASVKQRELMRRMKHPNAEIATVGDFRAFMTQLQKEKMYA
jgi:superfamily II DNA or RNA helicase